MVNNKRYQKQLTDWNRCLLEKGPERDRTERSNTRPFFFTTMLHYIWQNRFATRWRHSVEKFCPMRLTRQTWLLPIATCLHRWLHALAEQRFGSYKDVKKWLDERFAAKDGVVFTNCPIEAKNSLKKAMEHALNKAHFIILPNLTCFLGKKSVFRTCTAGILDICVCSTKS